MVWGARVGVLCGGSGRGGGRCRVCRGGGCLLRGVGGTRVGR